MKYNYYLDERERRFIESFSRPIQREDFGTRVYTTLRREGIYSWGDLTTKTVGELLKYKGIGRLCVDKIMKTLDDNGLGLSWE